MKKQCPHCQSYFFGRTDKLFCSLACKNSFHNQNRKSDLAYTIDHDLHHNRTVLQQLIPLEVKKATWSRKVLEKLGFKFELVTGFTRTSNGKIIRKVYEYTWGESTGDDIDLERTNGFTGLTQEP